MEYAGKRIYFIRSIDKKIAGRNQRIVMKQVSVVINKVYFVFLVSMLLVNLFHHNNNN
ncbi:hypothetical protein M472_09140 [Sphingobacterium paucimobilis HER1398]|uniref:Uncharacterized protein n=1 Tax=Sphingobacterium paucimobilis HER1398 TaxID=1346330 RepID=U2HUH7_9SPHI|nr:hypothetical protein M472_09140 [Sphingobacterium paucimobilis HER1398]